jgi:hypothetical protein
VSKPYYELGRAIGAALYQWDRERFIDAHEADFGHSFDSYTAREKVREEIANDGGDSWE